MTAWLGICFVSLLTVLIVTSWGEKKKKKRTEIYYANVTWASIPIGTSQQKRVFRCRFPPEWHRDAARKAKGRSKERQPHFTGKMLNWEIYEAQRLQSNGVTNGADKRGQRFLFFCSKWRHSDWGMKTEQHLRAHKAVHLNKQGYVLLLWAQWSPSKNMVMPHWMDARTPKLPPFHFVWKNVT